MMLAGLVEAHLYRLIQTDAERDQVADAVAHGQSRTGNDVVGFAIKALVQVNFFAVGHQRMFGLFGRFQGIGNQNQFVNRFATKQKLNQVGVDVNAVGNNLTGHFRVNENSADRIRVAVVPYGSWH